MSRNKIIQFDYDWIMSKDDVTAISVCLTWRERQILLSMLDQVGWLTRWTGTPVLDVIENWRDELFSKLIGECPVNCADVIACIIAALDGEGTDLEQTLIDWLGKNQNEIDVFPDGIGTIERSADNLTGDYGCNPDDLFGFAMQLTQAMNRWILDFFEIIEVATNSVELVGAVYDSVPLLTSLTDLVDYVVDTVRENYEANYDDELEQHIACDLFCLMMANETCSLTWDEILTYFSQQTAYELADVNLDDWGTFVLTGSWDGDEFVYIMFMTLVAVLGIGGDWTGISLAFIQRTIAAWFNDPDSDWAVLCTDCAWEYTIDFTVDGVGNWVVGSLANAENQGVFTASVGWEETPQDNSENPEEGHDWSKALCIEHPMSCDSQLTYVLIEYDFGNSAHWEGSDNTNVVVITHPTPLNTIYAVSAESHPTGSAYHAQIIANHPIENGGVFKMRFMSGRWWTNSNPGGYCTIKNITVRGTGDNPFD